MTADTPTEITSGAQSPPAPSAPPTRRGRSYARLAYSHPQRGTAYKDVSRHTTLIGSAVDAPIRLLSSEVAAAHCVITLDNDVLRIRALRPNAGVRVNGYPLEISVLCHGDRLDIGPFSFRVETNLTFELSRTAPIAETRMDMVDNVDTITSSSESEATTDTEPKPAPPAVVPSEPVEEVEEGEKPITVEFLKKLMLQGVLTRFQSEWILEGKFEEFKVGEFRIVDILGTGGMGWLYVAVNETTGEKAAVKVISKLMDNDYLTRFKLEARAGLMLNHPNLVRTLKLGETDEIWYVAMELVEGISLQELISRQGFIPWPQACSLVAQAAAGLQHAHEKGLIHRDIKPGNLLVKKNGTVKVLDFGLALMEQDEDEFMLTMISGQGCVGTADYIAPEQTLDSFAVGPPADIYSLGCTLYCALTGMVPFPGESVSKKLRAHRTGTARPIREIKPEVPAAVEAIVAKMMARKTSERYTTAAQVLAALQPHARRDSASFDFTQILAQRSAEARQRVNLLRQRR
ncbi:MAG TPA: FHA domain-containing serine/threonine-protein kinase [Planctomycetaceae bacterium]|jgi:serine/threonine protein kinase|nr:FHA domain-containing serine/threonine-protein kinase [Planctomycetaceae bacterium]